MARITTSKGEAVLRPMLGKDELILADLADLEDGGAAMAFYQVKGRMLRALDAALQKADWEGGFGELPKDEVLAAFVRWNTATDEDALPEGSAPNSATPPEPGR
jgi:hypothetical protein